MYLRKVFSYYCLIALLGILPGFRSDQALYTLYTESPVSSNPVQDDTVSPGKQFIQEYVGLQLYSLRNELDKDVPGTLAKAKQMGFRQVEVYNLHGLSALDFRLQLEKYNLHCTSHMVSYEMLRDKMKQVISNAKTLGASYVVCPWIPHQVGTFSLTEMEQAVKDFNEFGKKLKAQGLQFCYHIHGYEFNRYQEETLFDYMVAHTDPQFVNFEIDVYYVTLAGADPVALMQKYPSRFQLIHLKDVKMATPERNMTGKAPVEWSVSIGTGKVNFQAVLQQAQQIGIKHYYVEDESPDALQQIPQSLDYISKLQL